MKSKLTTRFWFALVPVALALTSGLSAQSRVGCGYLGEPKAALKPASFVLVSEQNAPIVGLWQIQFALPDGTVIDSGYATWHSDGTEIMNSGRAPMTSSFCMGAWKQTKNGMFKLNHFALSWDSTGQNLVGPANIRELVAVDHTGNHYSGTFTIDQYDTNGNLLAHVAGSVTATRITAN